MKLEQAIERLKNIKHTEKYDLEHSSPPFSQDQDDYHNKNIKAIDTILNHIEPECEHKYDYILGEMKKATFCKKCGVLK